MRLSGFHLPLEHLSASSLAKAVQCPEKWRRKYLLHEREVFGPDMFVGSVDHKTWEDVFRLKIDGKLTDDEHLLEAHNYTWQTTELEKQPAWLGADREALFATGQQMVLSYQHQAAGQVNPVAVEERFEERIAGVPVPLIGFIDVQTETEIVERKTSGQAVKAPKPDWLLQGRIYQLSQRKPVQWHVVTKQKTPQVLALDTLRLERSNPDHTVRMVQQIVQRLDDLFCRYGPNETWPTDGILHTWLCGYCQFGPKYQNDCEAWSVR